MTKQKRYLTYAVVGLAAGGLAVLAGVSVSTVVVVGLFVGMMLMHGGHGGHGGHGDQPQPEPQGRPSAQRPGSRQGSWTR